jgi:hypothetical protein
MALHDAPLPLAPAPSVLVLPPPLDVREVSVLAMTSELFPGCQSEAEAMVRILCGAEVGLGPMASLLGISLAAGVVVLCASTLAAGIKRSGHYDYRIVRLTDAICDLEIMAGADVLGTSTFALEDAERAGLLTGNHAASWMAQPRANLFSCALANAVRWHCPDVFGFPLVTPEELADAPERLVDTTATAALECSARGVARSRPVRAPKTSPTSPGAPERCAANSTEVAVTPASVGADVRVRAAAAALRRAALVQP